MHPDLHYKYFWTRLNGNPVYVFVCVFILFFYNKDSTFREEPKTVDTTTTAKTGLLPHPQQFSHFVFYVCVCVCLGENSWFHFFAMIHLAPGCM